MGWRAVWGILASVRVAVGLTGTDVAIADLARYKKIARASYLTLAIRFPYVTCYASSGITSPVTVRPRRARLAVTIVLASMVLIQSKYVSSKSS